jgi:hypothetical protein
MPHTRLFVTLAALACLDGGALLAANTPANPVETGDDGLQRVEVRGLDRVYARPGINLAVYDKVMLAPIDVAFSRNWKPEVIGTHFPIPVSERQRIKQGLAKIIREEFIKELQQNGRYQVVDAPADDVLQVNASIVDLYINAPDTMSPGMTRSYTLSTGEMTLRAELSDSASGQLLVRVVDLWRDPERTYLQLTTDVENTAAAREAAISWARILRGQLDKARAVPHKS